MANGCLAIVRECTAEGLKKHHTKNFETVEVPAALLSVIGATAINRGMERVKRGHLQREVYATRRETVRQLYGRQTNARIAKHLGISEAAVRFTAKRLRELGDLPELSSTKQHLLGDD